jgi:hypothetical protein
MAAFNYILQITGDCQSQNTGAITIVPTGGTEPYTVQWTSPNLGQDTAVLYSSRYNLSADTYVVRVNDSTLPTNQEFYINIPVSSGVCASILGVQDTTCDFANGSVTGTSTSLYSSTNFYLYDMSNTLIQSAVTNTSEVIFGNIDYGSYYMVAEDLGGCLGETQSFIIDTSTEFNFGLYVVPNSSCGGTPIGKITVTGQTGQAPFSYLWSNGQTGSTITGLTSGSYSVAVTDAYGCTKSAEGSVTNVNQTSHTFTVGGTVIIMQMQDDVIGTNTTNIAAFGNLGAIANAGVYEIGIISARSPAAGTPTTITFSSPLAGTYNTGTNSSLQLITLRDLGANYTTTATISGLVWDGNVGGVIGIQVTNTLTLNNSISANGIGFAGGTKNPNGYTACESTTYATAIATRYSGKGEGIYKRTNATFAGARGKIINGGGGGNDVNSGGGGGGNFSAGGSGGLGWVPAGTGCSPSVGGLGGISLNGQTSATRIFMGGGGGGKPGLAQGGGPEGAQLVPAT